MTQLLSNLDSVKRADSLGFNLAKSKFVTILNKLQPPMTVALYGQWGSGKTSMIEELQDDFPDRSIFFDAWKYRHEKDLTFPLLLKIKNQFLNLFDQETIKSFKRVLAGTFLSGSDLLIKYLTKDKLSLKDLTDGIKAYEDSEKSILDDYIDKVEEVEKEYKKLINSIFPTDKPLIIFIDNLDRCLPDSVVDLLENISAFLSYQGVACIFFLAIDKNHVVKAIEHRYPGFDGNQYLEKIIQIPLMMPKSKNLKQHVDTRIKLSANWKADEIEKISSEMEKLEKVFHDDFLTNPRRWERIINRILLVVHLSNSDEIFKNESHACLLVLFIILKEYFPEIYYALSDEVAISEMITLSTNSAHEQGDPKVYLKRLQTEQRNLPHFVKIVSDEFTQGSKFFSLLKAYSHIFRDLRISKNGEPGQANEASLKKRIKDIMSSIELIG